MFCVLFNRAIRRDLQLARANHPRRGPGAPAGACQ